VHAADAEREYYGGTIIPSVNLLPRDLVALRHLRNRRPINPDRQDNLELVFIAPTSPPLQTQNITTHRHLLQKTRR